MARSRLEKIGTIFDRVSGLLRSGAMKYEDKPLWYDVYEAFPPKLEPRYDRPAPSIQIKPIFYSEDLIRAKFQKDYKALGTCNLSNMNTLTVTQQFLSIYKKIKLENQKPDEEIYNEALNTFNNERISLQSKHDDIEEAPINLTKSAKSIDIKEIISDK